jgi:hypothetical protein
MPYRDDNVSQPQRFRSARDAWSELLVFHRAGRLGAIELHAPYAEQRQNGNSEHDNPKSAVPMQSVPPEIDGSWERIQPGQDG